jgi:hypothetical protein
MQFDGLETFASPEFFDLGSELNRLRLTKFHFGIALTYARYQMVAGNSCGTNTRTHNSRDSLASHVAARRRTDSVAVPVSVDRFLPDAIDVVLASASPFFYEAVDVGFEAGKFFVEHPGEFQIFDNRPVETLARN